MKKAKVLREFLFAADGINSKAMLVGNVIDVPDDCIAGLVNEGFVALEDAAAPVNPPEQQPENPEPVQVPVPEEPFAPEPAPAEPAEPAAEEAPAPTTTRRRR